MSWLTNRQWLKYLAAAAPVAIPEVLELPESARVLVFAPHPDDETFGCGGTLALLRNRSCQVQVVVVTDGANGDPERLFPDNVTALRNAELSQALALAEVQSIEHLGFPDGGFDAASLAARQRLAQVYDEFEPDWVLVPSLYESHRDHLGVSYLVLNHWARQDMQTRLLCYEVWGGLTANLLVDITAVMETKLNMIRSYRVPLSYLDYEAAMVGLARYRGLVLGKANEPRFAEAFLEVVSPRHARQLMKHWLGIRQTLSL